MTPLLAIVVKEARLMLRDPGGLLLLFLLPALFIVVLSVALQGAFSSDRAEDRLVMVFVAEGDGAVAEGLSERLAKAGLFRVVGPGRVDLDGARRGLGEKRWDVVVRVPEGAEEALHRQGEATVEVILDPVVSIEVARAAEAAVREATLVASLEWARSRLDEASAAAEEAAEGAREAEAAAEEARRGADACEKALDAVRQGRRPARPAAKATAVAEEQTDDDAEATADVGGDDETVGLGVTQVYAGGGDRSPRPNTVQQNVPGWTIFALFWIAQILAVNILGERQSGIHDRIRAAPLPTPLYLFAKLLPFLVVNLLQAVAMFAVGALLLPHLGLPRLVIVNVPALALITVAVSMVSVSFGLLMASLTRSTFFVASATAALLIIMTVVGGIMVPRFVMPAVLQRASLAVPHGWALEAYHAILVRGGSLADILPHVGALTAFAAAFFAAALLRTRLSRP